MHKVKGVVVKAKNEPATVETILVPDPGPGEALVDVLTCGVCGAWLWPLFEFPVRLLGQDD